MKPRWHVIKINRDGFQKTGWARPAGKTQHILLFDGLRKESITQDTCLKLEQAKDLQWGECLVLKKHMLIEDQYKACQAKLLLPGFVTKDRRQVTEPNWSLPDGEQAMGRVERRKRETA